MRCAVCDQAVNERWGYLYHHRLDAYICWTCPLTDVFGEDVSTHAMELHPPFDYRWSRATNAQRESM